MRHLGHPRPSIPSVEEARYEGKKSGIEYGKIGCLQAVIIGSKVPRKG